MPLSSLMVPVAVVCLLVLEIVLEMSLWSENEKLVEPLSK